MLNDIHKNFQNVVFFMQTIPLQGDKHKLHIRVNSDEINTEKDPAISKISKKILNFKTIEIIFEHPV